MDCSFHESLRHRTWRWCCRRQTSKTLCGASISALRFTIDFHSPIPALAIFAVSMGRFPLHRRFYFKTYNGYLSTSLSLRLSAGKSTSPLSCDPPIQSACDQLQPRGCGGRLLVASCSQLLLLPCPRIEPLSAMDNMKCVKWTQWYLSQVREYLPE